MMKRLTALMLCGSMLSGCATAGARFASFDQSYVAAGAQQTSGSSVLAEYVQKLPLGMRIRVDRVAGGAVKGTLMKATNQIIVVQRRTRIPEPPVEIPLTQVLAVTPEASGGGGMAKAIGAGAAAGAGAALAIILILIAAYDD